MLTLWYNLRVMKFHGILALSAVIAALASCADAGEFAHDAASLARALTAQDGAGLKFDFSAVVTYVCTNNFDRRINIAAEDASGTALVCTSDDVRPAFLPMPGTSKHSLSILFPPLLRDHHRDHTDAARVHSFPRRM